MHIATKIFKGLSNLLLNIILIVLVLCVFVATVLSITFYNMNTKLEDSRTFYLENYVYMDNCYVDRDLLVANMTADLETEINYSTVSEVVSECLAKFPVHAQSYITNNWVIVFTRKAPPIAGEYLTGYNASDYSAVTVPDLQTIFVFIDNASALSYVLTHEFGHVIAYEYGSLDHSEEFINLYFLFKDTYKEDTPFSVPGYATSSSPEFFASALQAYLDNPTWLWKEAPGAAQYMQKLLANRAYESKLEMYYVRTQGLIRTFE